MPISIQVTEGLLRPDGLRQVFPRIAQALLRAHGIEGNAFMEPAVIGHVQRFSEEDSYAGGQPGSLAVVEVKVPSITFPEQAVRDAFVQSVTDIIDELQTGRHPRSRTFVNVTYAVDGAWGIGGRAYTNAALGQAIAAAAR
jgi:phenylpyruvate tautomerase PptA (4-oxalocrotonate tautomerase family)